MNASEAALSLAGTYGWARDRSERVVAIARTFGVKAEPTTGGYVLVKHSGGKYLIEDHTGRQA